MMNSGDLHGQGMPRWAVAAQLGGGAAVGRGPACRGKPGRLRSGGIRLQARACRMSGGAGAAGRAGLRPQSPIPRGHPSLWSAFSRRRRRRGTRVQTAAAAGRLAQGRALPQSRQRAAGGGAGGAPAPPSQAAAAEATCGASAQPALNQRDQPAAKAASEQVACTRRPLPHKLASKHLWNWASVVSSFVPSPSSGGGTTSVAATSRHSRLGPLHSARSRLQTSDSLSRSSKSSSRAMRSSRSSGRPSSRMVAGAARCRGGSRRQGLGGVAAAAGSGCSSGAWLPVMQGKPCLGWLNAWRRLQSSVGDTARRGFGAGAALAAPAVSPATHCAANAYADASSLLRCPASPASVAGPIACAPQRHDR